MDKVVWGFGKRVMFSDYDIENHSALMLHGTSIQQPCILTPDEVYKLARSLIAWTERRVVYDDPSS